MEYYQDGGGSAAQLLWSSDSQIKEIIPSSQLYPGVNVDPAPGDSGTGLRGAYYDNSDWTGLVDDTVLDPTIDFNWGYDAPSPNGQTMGADWFVIRWTGEIQPQYDDTYTLCAEVDDQVRVWIGGTLVIDQWEAFSGAACADYTFADTGRYPIQIDFRERYNSAIIRLLWQSDHQMKEIVPSNQLYPHPE
jgi:hypothetical protein